MIARIADHLFWFGRYLERVETTARQLFVTHNLALDADLPSADLWRPVIITTGEAAPFHKRYGDDAMGDGERVQNHLTWDSETWVSLRRSVAMARDNARGMREVVSLEVWQAVNELHLWFDSDAARHLYDTHRYDFYRHVQRSAQLALGLTQGTMLHDEALDLLWLGVFLERIGQIARTLDVHHHALSQERLQDGAVDAVVWIGVLRTSCALEPYTKRRPGQVTAQAVAEFLLFQADFPRSVRFAVREAYACLGRVRPPQSRELPGGKTLEALRVLAHWVDDQARSPGLMNELHAALTHIVDESTRIGALLGRELFGYP